MKKTQSGFSLIELLIVVVIIGIIAAIAIPNLLAARRAANEGSAQASLRTIHGAQATYQGTVGGGDFAAALADLRGQSLVDSSLGSGNKSGYNFNVARQIRNVTNPAQYCAAATPEAFGSLLGVGLRDYGIATPGVIYAAPAPSGTVMTCMGAAVLSSSVASAVTGN